MRMALKSGKGSLVLILGKTARKWFCGPGAQAMLERERIGLEIASRCPVWGSPALPLEFRKFRTTVAAAGQRFSVDNEPELGAFVTDRVRAALSVGIPQPAVELFSLAALENVLCRAGGSHLLAKVQAVVAELVLPSGPTHGDLHRGNLLLLEGLIRVIDFDRFRPVGCPLFDLLHFQLGEEQRGTGRRWLDELCARSDLVETAALGLVAPDALFIAYSLQRIGHEGQAAVFQGKPLGKYASQTEQALSCWGQRRRAAESIKLT